MGDDEEAAEAISKVVALHVISDGLTIFALDFRKRSPDHSSSVLRPSEVALPSGLERPRRRDDTRASSSFSSSSFRRADFDDRARSNVSRELRRRSKSRCRLNDRLPLHISTKELSLSAVSRGRTKYGKKLEKMRSVQSSHCWATARLIFSSAPTSLSPRRGRVIVETVGRMTSYIYDVTIGLMR